MRCGRGAGVRRDAAHGPTITQQDLWMVTKRRSSNGLRWAIVAFSPRSRRK